MIRVLVADDSTGWRNFHQKMLSEISDEFEITICEWAKDAYEIIFQNIKTPFDLIITDLQMEGDFSPQYAGEWLVERIKELSSYNNTPIIMISATFNIKNIAENYGVECLPKSQAIDLISYKLKISEVLKREF